MYAPAPLAGTSGVLSLYQLLPLCAQMRKVPLVTARLVVQLTVRLVPAG